MTTYDTWSETAKISIAAQGGSDVRFEAITETIDIDIGNKDFDVIATLSGGRFVKFTPQEPTTITFEAYPVQAGTSSGQVGYGFFDLLWGADTSQPLQIDANVLSRDKYRVAIMWTTDTSSTMYADGQVGSPANSALRVIASDGYFTSVKPSFTDGILKFTVTFKVPPVDKSGNDNIRIESIDGSATATLTALASYTSTVKY